MANNIIWPQECPSKFQRGMDELLELSNDFIANYIDDFLNFSDRIQENIHNLNKLL